MKLYLLHRCPYGHRAAFALAEKKIAFESVFFDHAKRPPELEAVSPHAKSPTVFDGDERVYDSLVVLEYLEDKYPTPALLPTSPIGRAQVRVLIARVSEELAPKQGAVIREIMKRPRDEAALGTALKAFGDALGAWDQRLEGHTFAVGDTFTLADIVLYTFFPSLEHLAGFEVDARHTHLRGWLDRMASRETSKVPSPARS